MLRGIVYFGYKFNEHFVFNSEIEFEHSTTSKSGSASVEFAYVDYLYRPGFNIRGGLLLVPMGLINEIHEPTTFLGAKRPETERGSSPRPGGRTASVRTGISPASPIASYVMNGLDASGFSAAGLRGGRQKGSKAKAEDFAWVGRVDWTDTPGSARRFLRLLRRLRPGFASQPTAVRSACRRLSGRRTSTGRSAPCSCAACSPLGARRCRSSQRGPRLRRAAHRSAKTMEGYYLQAGWDLLARRQGAQSLTPYLRWENVDTQKEVPDG